MVVCWDTFVIGKLLAGGACLTLTGFVAQGWWQPSWSARWERGRVRPWQLCSVWPETCADDCVSRLWTCVNHAQIYV